MKVIDDISNGIIISANEAYKILNIKEHSSQGYEIRRAIEIYKLKI